MVYHMKEVENLTGNYIAALGFYRFFYILSWFYRYLTIGDFCWTKTLGGIL